MIKSRLTIAATLLIALLVSLTFQNCGEVRFASTTDSKEKVLICDVDSIDGKRCEDIPNGFKGHIFYFLDTTSGESIPNQVFDKFGAAINFPDGLTGVRMFFERAFQVEAELILSKVAIPTIRFSQGFQDSNGNFVMDETGKILHEAFALKLQTNFKLAPGMSEGLYEFAILSDDGSIVSVDLNRTGNYTTLIDNDGLHSPRLGCSNDVIQMSSSRILPIRIEYYQGPRTDIALTFLARRIHSGPERTLDPLCNYTSRTAWFNGDPNHSGYVPDYVNGKFGELIDRGWFVPEGEALNF